MLTRRHRTAAGTSGTWDGPCRPQSLATPKFARGCPSDNGAIAQSSDSHALRLGAFYLELLEFGVDNLEVLVKLVAG